MVEKDLVTKVNGDLKKLKDEASREGASPYIIRLADALLALTALDGEDVIEAAPAVAAVTAAPEKSAPGNCKHPNLSPFGQCRDCGTCLHQFVGSGGTCNTCGEQITEAA